MLSQLKAIAAGAVGLLSLVVMNRFGFEISADVQAAIVGAIVYAVTYVVPNLKSDPA
jgi:hypothetical protein